MTIMQAEVITGLAKYNMNLSATARGIPLGPSVVYYYVYKTIDETGLDPRKFYDLCELLPIANAVLEDNHGN